MKRTMLVFVMVLLLSSSILLVGCISTLPRVPGGSIDYSGSSITGQEEIDFQNTPEFEQLLSASLREEFASVTVHLEEKYRLNAPPRRLAKWIAAVQQYGGSYEVAVDPQYQGQSSGILITMLIDFINGLIQKWEDRPNYKYAANYNITVYNHPMRTGDDQEGPDDDMITDVVFNHK